MHPYTNQFDHSCRSFKEDSSFDNLIDTQCAQNFLATPYVWNSFRRLRIHVKEGVGNEFLTCIVLSNFVALAAAVSQLKLLNGRKDTQTCRQTRRFHNKHCKWTSVKVYENEVLRLQDENEWMSRETEIMEEHKPIFICWEAQQGQCDYSRH